MAGKSQEVIKAYMKEQTPDNPDDAILAEYDQRMENYEEGSGKSEFTYGVIADGLAQISRNHGYHNPRYLQSLLKRTERAKRTKHGIVYEKGIIV